MISPKLVEVGRHINIELITCSEVESVDGESGNFEVTLVNHPRYIDLAKCTLCAACVDACKLAAIKIEKEAKASHKLTGAQLAQYKDVWVFAEQKLGVVQSVVFELLGKGKELAQRLGVNLCAVCFRS